TTPMMQQYRDAKAKHPDMLLFFRMGDFYELFESDAETAHKVLGLTLTSRDKEMPMAGFPHHQLESYLHKLLHAGLRVAVCDQVEDASQAKGLVKREVTRVVTPGMVTEDDLLDPNKNTHLAAIYRRRPRRRRASPGLTSRRANSSRWMPPPIGCAKNWLASAPRSASARRPRRTRSAKSSSVC